MGYGKDDIPMDVAARVFEYAEEGICITDTMGNIIYVNPEFTRTTGYTLKEALGQNPRILKSGRHPQSFYEVMWNDLINKGKWQGEIWNKRKNKQIYPESLSIHAVRNDKAETTHYVAIFRDITHDMELRKEIELASAIQRNTLREDFKHRSLEMESLYCPYNHLSGDYYDYRFDEERQILSGFLFDVMGHGVATAMQVSAMMVLFRQIANKPISLKEKMKWINQQSRNILPDDSFVGAILFSFDLKAGKLNYVAAGINHLLIYTVETSKLSEVSIPGMYLGINKDEEFDEHHFALA